jgi:hypothetical protein
MGELRKPQFSKERRSFFSTPSLIRRTAFCGTFALLLWFAAITGIPPAHGASSLYLPLILKLHHDDVPSPPPLPTPPPDSQFDKVFVNPRVEGDVDQIQFGTPGKDKIEQYGGTGKTTQYAEGSADADWLLQVGGDLRTDQTTIAGSGDDKIYQYGGKGDTTQFIEVGAGNKTLIQVGGDGINIMQIEGGDGSATIEQYGGKVDNTMTLGGSTGDDIIKMYGGAATDTMDYTITGGSDKVTINAGQGDDTLTINKNLTNFTLFDNGGSVIFKSGDGGSAITVTNTEHIKVIGDDGTIIFQWDAL